jgi:hypothetical protein
VPAFGKLEAVYGCSVSVNTACKCYRLRDRCVWPFLLREVLHLTQ